MSNQYNPQNNKLEFKRFLPQTKRKVIDWSFHCESLLSTKALPSIMLRSSFLNSIFKAISGTL